MMQVRISEQGLSKIYKMRKTWTSVFGFSKYLRLANVFGRHVDLLGVAHLG